MNQKNSLGLDICFKDEDNPFKLFEEWFDLAKEKEPNDPNALALAGFVFYTNLNSPKSKALSENPKASMCFHWKSLLRQIRISGTIENVSDKEADDYYYSRKYGSRIGAWASKQSTTLKNRDELISSIEKYKKKYPETNEVPRPEYWSGWRLIPNEIEFWLDGENRIHGRLKYKFEQNRWDKFLLSP